MNFFFSCRVFQGPALPNLDAAELATSLTTLLVGLACHGRSREHVGENEMSLLTVEFENSTSAHLIVLVVTVTPLTLLYHVRTFYETCLPVIESN